MFSALFASDSKSYKVLLICEIYRNSVKSVGMVNKKLFVVLGIGFILMQSSCVIIKTSSSHSDDENVIEQIIELSSFDAIDISASEVVFKLGDENKIIYNVCEPIADDVLIEAKNNKLSVGINGNRENHLFKCEIISKNHLKNIDVSGACKFRYEGDIAQEEMDIDISGASTITINGMINVNELDIDASGASNISIMNVACGKLDIDVSGASKAELKGKCRNAYYDASGASSISVRDMVAQDAEANASGASDVDLTATGKVRHSSSGASTIRINR